MLQCVLISVRPCGVRLKPWRIMSCDILLQVARGQVPVLMRMNACCCLLGSGAVSSVGFEVLCYHTFLWGVLPGGLRQQPSGSCKNHSAGPQTKIWAEKKEVVREVG